MSDEPKETQPTITPMRGEVTDNHHLKLARQQIEKYEDRINADTPLSGDARRAWEDIAYKRAMMHAAYAQAEAATRQAEVMESLLDLFDTILKEEDQ